MVPSAAYIQYVTIVDLYIVGPLCAFGIAGNVLSIVVLGHDQTIRRTTGFLMQMLAVTDAAFLVSCLSMYTLTTALKWTDWFPGAVHRVWPYVYVYSYPMMTVTWTASVWMVVVLTADRYIAICRPLHTAQYSTLPRLRRAVAVLWVLAVALNLPRFFELRVAEVKTDQVSPSDGFPLNGLVSSNYSTTWDIHVNLTQNSTSSESHSVLELGFREMVKNQVYQVVYKMCLDFVVRFLLPLAALVFFNQSLIRALRQSDQLRHHSATDGGTGRQHTWMLVVVVIVFVVCQLPGAVWRVCWVLYQYAGVPFSLSALNYALVAIDLMLVVNSSVNVVIYCFVGRQFRAILLRMIGCGSKCANVRQNSEKDPEHPAVPQHHVPTSYPPQHSQSGRESPTSHQSACDDVVCQLNWSLTSRDDI